MVNVFCRPIQTVLLISFQSIFAVKLAATLSSSYLQGAAHPNNYDLIHKREHKRAYRRFSSLPCSRHHRKATLIGWITVLLTILVLY
jgi:hypothetical protein